MNIVQQAKDIIKGHVKELLNDEDQLSAERMKICKKCPLFTDKLGGTCDRNKFYNFKTSQICEPGSSDDCVHGCGCRMQAKTRLPYSICVGHRW